MVALSMLTTDRIGMVAIRRAATGDESIRSCVDALPLGSRWVLSCGNAVRILPTMVHHS